MSQLAVLSIEPEPFSLRLFCLDADGDDEVAGSGGAYVFEAVHDVGGSEDDSAGADGFGLAVVDELDVAFADEDEFGVAVLVGRMRHLSRGKRGLVDFDELAGGEGSGENLAAGASVGVLFDGELIVGEDDRFGELAIGACSGAGLGFGHYAAHGCKGGERGE